MLIRSKIEELCQDAHRAKNRSNNSTLAGAAPHTANRTDEGSGRTSSGKPLSIV